jgi:Meckel syndrome type 1 protein
MTAALKRVKLFLTLILTLILSGAAAVALGCGTLAAASLDQEACQRLKTELMQLELAGARSNMAKGPEWAKGNLSADKLGEIKRLLEVDEQILFRCQGRPLIVLPEGVDGEPAAERKNGAAAAARPPAGAVKEPSKAGPSSPAKASLPPSAKAGPPPPAKANPPPPAKAGPLPSAKASPPPSAKAAGGAGAAKPAADKASPAKAAPPAPAKPKPKPKPNPTPKVDDAYRPPAVSPGTNPFPAKP